MEELRFRTDAFQPAILPMARLAEYMAELASLLGHEKSVHFVRLDPGSVALIHRIDAEDRPKVNARLEALRQGEGHASAVKAYHAIDDMLANDNTVGMLADDQNSVIIRFPGKTRQTSIDYGAFEQQGSFDGIPVKVGGLKDLVPIMLQKTDPAASVHHCVAPRSIARAIAPYLFETPVRVHGIGRWHREDNGAWKLMKFTINDFSVLDSAPLDIVAARLRAIEDNGWRAIECPFATLRGLRDGEDGVP